MDKTSTHSSPITSSLSFRPLIRELEKTVREGRSGIGNLYKDLLNKVYQHPELLEPIRDLSLLDTHKELIEQLMATVFPVTLSDKEDLYGAAIPFQFTMFYASSKMQQDFLDTAGNKIKMPNCETEDRMHSEKIVGAYQMILNRYFNTNINNGVMTSVYEVKCPDTGLDTYTELELDARFIEVKVKGDLPHLPIDCGAHCHDVTDLMSLEALKEMLPLSLFEFEGMIILRLRDVTQREVLNIIRNRLLDLHTFSDKHVFAELQEQVQNLIGLHGVNTAIKPFFRVNNHLVLSEIFSSSNIDRGTKKEPTPEQLQFIYQAVTKAFKNSERPLLIPNINDEAVMRHPFMVMLAELGYKSAIICPLFADNHDMLGVLLIVSEEPNIFNQSHIARIEPAIPLFKLAMEKSQENLDHQVDRVIKDQFTAVQDAVEWRFTEEALRYLTRKSKGEQVKIEPIVFQNVYPMYGAIDIRNSSVERNNAIQLDLLEQLNLAHDIVQLAKKEHPFPLLDETSFKLQKFKHSVSNILFADEEIAILQFLKVELINLFKHLQSILPSLNREINRYFDAINSPVEMVYHHRKEYEDSITTINTAVARFIDREQEAAQKIFPHYFERFVTDGVDFNIYIGQSISPDKKFDFFYLKNLKIWQLSTLAKAARLTHKLEKELPLRLQTSQLILAHSHPISISFRTAERKFDVDGAYNIRYEIIKKRIDKVHVKDSNERLTQPGTIAIVYSQPQEAQEYLEYVEFLQNQGLLKGEVQKFDLEELQGVSGLKGLRVAINLEEEQEPDTKKEEKKQAVI
ncbi:GAF domain-containing protein [Paraflavitalea pollutisoli]|uniref:GAF domain-containing protein n=1 Tax=Paraflavitalea pollutisoli TaxID=3034143 RepID=UPI0023EDCA4B|nr:GAF domain-containing protein [Paraflavitalea sp. H1-2-19X]